MNATPLSSPSSAALPARPVAPVRRSRGSWVWTTSGVCFIFGALVATQMRAIQKVNLDRELNAESLQAQTGLLKVMRSEMDQQAADRLNLLAKVSALSAKLASSGTLSASQIQTLNDQIRELQAVAGLTRVNGSGLRIVLSDNPQAAQGDPGPFLPGIVHDFDVLQVVNELRSCKADAIAVNGVRLTEYTPIRCVGPTIMVNWEPVAAPFRIEAIGDEQTMESALTMPDGIVDNLKNNGAIGVKLTPVKNLTLESATSIPSFQVAKSIP